MLCAKCGTTNTDTAIVCKNCSALLSVVQGSRSPFMNLSAQPFSGGPWDLSRLPVEQQSTVFQPSPQAQPASAPEQPWFAPIAHSPFSEEPLPQPSQPIPTLIQPVDEIMTFVSSPTPDSTVVPFPQTNMDLADYPTSTSVPVPEISPRLSTGKQPFPGRSAFRSPSQFLENTFSPPSDNSWGQDVNYGPLNQALPDSEPFNDNAFAGYNNTWVQEEQYTPLGQATPASQPLVNNTWVQEDQYAPLNQAPSISQPLSNAYPGWVQVQEEAYTPFNQPPPKSQHLGNGYSGMANNLQVQEESYTPFNQPPPKSQPLGNVFPGPVNADFSVSGGSLQRLDAQFEPEVSKLIRPLPIWATLTGFVAGALLLGALVFLNQDWATGAMIASVIAIVMAMLLLIATGVRAALGLLLTTNPHRRAQVISVTLLVLLLFLVSGVGLSQQTSLHAMQARHLEGQQSWQDAVTEYQAAGEVPPASLNLARVYNEWGEALSGQQQYASAIEKFNTVLHTYGQVSSQTNLAQTNLLAAYQAWGNYATQHQDYAGATAHYDALLGLHSCDSACQTQTQGVDATAYYNLAEQQLAAQQFVPAVNAFGVLTTRFSAAPEAKKAHADYAKALWSVGQQQLTTTCSTAVKTYQQLSKQFSDTTQGQQATTALQQPVAVKGHFTTQIPAAPNSPRVALVQGMFVGIQPGPFTLLLQGAPNTTVNSDGTFTFSAVPQSTYSLVWSSDKLHYYYNHSNNQVLYTASFGPLCTYNFGDINETIPTGN